MTLRNDQWLFTVPFGATLNNAHLSWAGDEQGGRLERGRSLLELYFMETTGDIYSGLTATQIGSYSTLRKATFTQCDDVGPFFREKN